MDNNFISRSKIMKDNLGDRMKEYESVTKHSLLRRTPVLLRLDGKAFHTFTKRITSTVDTSLTTGPFSHKLHNIFTRTTQSLINEIQNAKIGYTQSDEITILLNDWGTLKTDQWFNGDIQKIVSVSASLATGYFNKFFTEEFGDAIPNVTAFFDSRAFNTPISDVTNNFIWRQQDATRNSINMLGQFYFTHKELYGKNTSQVQDMLMLQHNVNWNNLDVWKKRGVAITRKGIDENTPIFTQDRDYIEQHLAYKD